MTSGTKTGKTAVLKESSSRKTQLTKKAHKMLLAIFETIQRDYGIPLDELTGKFGIPVLEVKPLRTEPTCCFITREGRQCSLRAKNNGLCHRHAGCMDKLKELETLFKKRFEAEEESLTAGLGFDGLHIDTN